MLVVRDGVEGEFPGVWRLPGGAVAHAEHPERAVVRAVAEQAGLTVAAGRLRAVVADVTSHPEGVSLHTDRLFFELTQRVGRLEGGSPGGGSPGGGSPGGGLRGDTSLGDHSALGAGPVADASTGDGPRADGSLGDGPAADAGGGLVDRVAWLTLAEAAGLSLTPFTAEMLGLPVTPLPPGTHRPDQSFPPPHPDRRLRFGAYGLVTDPAGRILLTQIADGYPGAGLWHLPGGGTDHGEQPTTGLLRELVEEGGQLGRVVELLGVDNLHNPAALGPEGRPLDWHGVRVIYRVLVDVPTDAVVTESAGGSTARAGWFTRAEAVELPLSNIAALAIGQSGR
ncbi:ADP-ribose pyrophosphatase YjhB (NUDIX family) [Micromonospora jinlongensis]|uniref:ADP-ribose pyrophosphatase YjhB (NUDIX family) n=1 Tax=Micromonospora jinlongensis TaxID=1287877 RepID=A0A7Y9X3V4_9ACTN|nr:ADP-ribose pyrophosphatase YjhB (NUDIX family) [Micromonospora jinlongensis]